MRRNSHLFFFVFTALSSVLALALSSMAAMLPASLATSGLTVYFGYGSNLWLRQMALRCPNSTYIGIARLPNFRWIINTRGYANVVELPLAPGGLPPNQPSQKRVERKSCSCHEQDWDFEVWGMVYSLTSSDEARLDRNEGVPIAYTKEMLAVEFWPTIDPAPPNVTLHKGLEYIDTNVDPERKSVLVYVDRERVNTGTAKSEYVHRMNMGIRDALCVGVPSEYIDAVMRKFIPMHSGGMGGNRALSMQQAAEFIEEDELERRQKGLV